jgi:hypothetical protein
MEAIWVATEMRAGGSYAHSIIALSAMELVEVREASLHGGQEAGEHNVSGAE